MHRKFGTAGLIVAVLALVVALTGAAFAAGGGLTGKEKKQVVKIAKKFAGKTGAAGAKGDTGAKGEQGIPGAPGKNGIDGEDGACSNAEPTCVLPPDATETGVWSVFAGGETLQFDALSFNLQVPTAPEIHYINVAGEELFLEGSELKERPSTVCLGDVAEPTAAPGNLCLYADFEGGMKPDLVAFTKTFTTGANIAFSVNGGGGYGTWAVTS